MKTIGVFDSGVGGLSVLRALLSEIPDARFVYVADSGYAPYGERSAQDVTERAKQIAAYLCSNHAIDALVVACNTATSLAIDDLRASFPDLPVVGVEPALRPASLLSRSGHIGVMATRGTLDSARFVRLRQKVLAETDRPLHFNCQACDGLADAIERDDEAQTRLLCTRYLESLRVRGANLGHFDTLVLGCTHYPFAASILQDLCGPDVTLVETGIPVARRTRSVLQLGTSERTVGPDSRVSLFCSGDPASLTLAGQRWLGLLASASPMKG